MANFIGGYIPYTGAFLGGGLAVIVACVVTALGGFLAGIVGLILAVPFTVIAARAIGLLRAKGSFRLVADRAQPAVQKMLD